MIKKIELNDSIYFIETEIDEQRKCIEVEAYLSITGKGLYSSTTKKKIFEVTVRENLLLEKLGISLEKRVSNKIRKAMKVVNKFDNKSNKLKNVDKYCDDVFNLDEKMEL
jgi:hypothetical protein